MPKMAKRNLAQQVDTEVKRSRSSRSSSFENMFRRWQAEEEEWDEEEKGAKEEEEEKQAKKDENEELGDTAVAEGEEKKEEKTAKKEEKKEEEEKEEEKEEKGSQQANQEPIVLANVDMVVEHVEVLENISFLSVEWRQCEDWME